MGGWGASSLGSVQSLPGRTESVVSVVRGEARSLSALSGGSAVMTCVCVRERERERESACCEGKGVRESHSFELTGKEGHPLCLSGNVWNVPRHRG